MWAAAFAVSNVVNFEQRKSRYLIMPHRNMIFQGFKCLRVERFARTIEADIWLCSVYGPSAPEASEGFGRLTQTF